MRKLARTLKFNIATLQTSRFGEGWKVSQMPPQSLPAQGMSEQKVVKQGSCHQFHIQISVSQLFPKL